MRYKYIDTARVLLMTLGIFLHAAMFFMINYDAAVYFDTRDTIFDTAIFFIHTFRMPAFFLIGGFLGALALNKYRPMEFLQRRTIRLLLPFAVFVAFVNTWVIHRISNEPMTGEIFPTLHLWFLPVLMMCATLHSQLFRPDQLSRVLPKFCIPDVLLAPAIVCGGAIVWFLFLRVMWHLPLRETLNLTDGFVNFVQFGDLLPMYCGGAILYHYRSHLEKVLLHWRFYLMVTLTYFGLHAVREGGYVTELFRYAAGIGMTFLTLSFCRYALPSWIAQPWMANYSYTLYLFHYPVLLALRLPVMTHINGVVLRYFVMCSVTIAVCSVLHLIILHSPLLSYLLNGESKNSQKDYAGLDVSSEVP